MKYRKLRIAWSVGCGVACLLLIGLWVRSYWSNDHLRGTVPVAGDLLVFDSTCGVVELDVILKVKETKWKWGSRAPRKPRYQWFYRYYPSTISWHHMAAPHWFLVLITGLIAVVPWFRWSKRFSLRTLLIGMTVAAIGLGWIVYASR